MTDKPRSDALESFYYIFLRLFSLSSLVYLLSSTVQTPRHAAYDTTRAEHRTYRWAGACRTSRKKHPTAVVPKIYCRWIRGYISVRTSSKFTDLFIKGITFSSKQSRNLFNWRCVYFVWPIEHRIETRPIPTKQRTVGLIKVKSCIALTRVLLISIRSYLKSVLRYKFLISDTFHPYMLILREQGYEDPWLFFETKKGPRAKNFGKHCPIGLGSHAKLKVDHNNLLSHFALRVEHPF